MFAFNTPAFALLTRSLREDNRLKQTYFARGGLICFILLMLLSSQNSYGYTGAPGLAFFSKVVFTNFFFITLTGLSYFAGAIAEEKEEGTLGLLRMTNLGPLTILLGKSSSRLLGIALLLLVQLPFTLLAVTLGGVSIHQVLAAYVSLGAYIFFVCNLALLFSVIFERVGVASTFTGLALLCFFFAPPWGGAILALMVSPFGLIGPQNAVAQGIGWGLQILARASAFGQLESILTNGFANRLLGFQVLSNLALGVGFFLLAWWGFDRFTRERRPGMIVRKLPTMRLSRFGMTGAGRVWEGAVWWKDFFLLHGGWNTAIVKLAIYICLAFIGRFNILLASSGSTSSNTGLIIGSSITYSALLIFAAELAFGAGRIFRAEIRGKTLAGLLGLPIPVARIAYQKVGALLLSTAPVLLIAVVGVAYMAVNDSHDFDEALAAKDFWLAIFFIGTQGLLFLHLIAYLSLYLKRLSLAVAVAMMFVGNMLGGTLAGLIFRFGPAYSAVVLYHCGLLALAAFLHVKIGGRLKQLAATEG